MHTQIEFARAGVITPVMKGLSDAERIPAEKLRVEVASGRAVIPYNPIHAPAHPVVVGRLFRTKVNANIGRSPDCSDTGGEATKLKVALDAGADVVMDLSVGPDLAELRQALLSRCPVPLGTVPLYEAVSRVQGRAVDLTAELLLTVIREQAEQGVDFMTLHAGLLQSHLPAALKRMMGIVSRGGALMAEWMDMHHRENPLYTCWDEVLDICRKHDVTVSLGDGLRPGCLADANDAAQFGELDVLGELVQKTRSAGVQVMVEGPGHVSFDRIAMNMERQQRVCDGAPFYVLGPVVTDIAPGYDHITSSIGATAATYHGASLLCYVTPAEHLGLPTADEVRQGVIAHRIAAHAGDVARGLAGAREADDAMARARMALDWEGQFALALDGDRARARYAQTRKPGATQDDHCSMCGKDFCAIRTTRRIHEHKSH